MPKDELDPEDPLELCGVALLTEEDTSDAMTECFVEEFLRLGYSPAQVLALFRNPHYTGPNMVFANRGEPWVRTKIAEVFGWWGRPAPAPVAEPTTTAPPTPTGSASEPPPPTPPAAQSIEFEPSQSDPGGAAVPRIQL